MKILDIFRTAAGNLRQSKLRTFLTVIAIFIGSFTLTLTTGIGAGISQYIDAQVNSIGAENVLMIQAKQPDVSIGADSNDPKKYDPNQASTQADFGGGSGQTIASLVQKDIDKIKSEPGIIDVTPDKYVSPSYIYGSNGEKYVTSAGQYTDGTNVAMNAGKVPDNSSSEPQVTIPYNYVSVLGFSGYADAIGKTVTIGIADPAGTVTEVKATVVGVPEKSLLGEVGGNSNTALFDKLYAAENVGVPASSLGTYTTATAHFSKSLTESEVTDLKARLDKDGYKAQTIKDTIGIVKQIINSVVYVFDAFAVIALLAASFGVINTLLMSVQERTKEIGLMKAMGMRRGRIFLLFSAEAVLLGFWGSSLGVLVAMALGTVANGVATNTFLKDFEGLHLLAFPPANLALIILGIMAVAFLAGTLPARRASGLNPIDALRYE